MTRTAGRMQHALRTAGHHWGTTAAERAAECPCDDVLPAAEQWLFRGIDIAASAPIVFRWVCQLRAGPYSYDWIDNRGRRSPRTLTPGLEDVRPGQPAMAIFEIADVEPGRSLTLYCRRSIFGEMAATYRVVPAGDRRSRLVVKLGIVYPDGWRGAFMRDLLPLGDLVMMRKQLRTLASLAERDARARPPTDG